jgi:hypothetical protein
MLIRRWPAVMLALFAGTLIVSGGGAGCTQSRIFTISTRPPGANVIVDKVDRGRAPVSVELAFASDKDFHVVIARRPGFEEQTRLITADEKKAYFVIDLEPLKRDVAFRMNVPAHISIDGNRVTGAPTMFYEAKRLSMGIDTKTNSWQSHTIVAEAPGFQTAKQTVSWLDQQNYYDLTLLPLAKDISITASPSGAEVYVDDKLIGTAVPDKPLVVRDLTFQMLDNNQVETHKLRVIKPGYEPFEMDLAWDTTKEYGVELSPRKKAIRLTSDPPGATFQLDGQDLSTDSSGAATVEREFIPNDKGDLPTFTGMATRTGDKDYKPTPFSIGWDEGRKEYTVKLTEVPTRNVPLLTAKWVRGDAGWEVTPEVVDTIAMKDKTDGPKAPRPAQVARIPERLPPGSCLDAFAVSPDGRQLLFTVLMGSGKNDFRSQMYRVRTDGSVGIDQFSEGKSLDLSPTYTPGGENIYYASNFAGRRMSIWKIAATGALPRSQITSDTNDIYPSVDSDPQPRMYYQSFIDTRTQPGIFSFVLTTSTRSDMTRIGGGEPRVSPRNDQVVFTSANEKTDKRDLYIVPANGGAAQKLTDTPNVDECNPVWNRDGSRIAFASDAGVDANGRHNYDIWIMDMNDTKHPTQQLTTNASVDDLPVWDPTGRNVYFRSNRGGEWGIWRMPVK